MKKFLTYLYNKRRELITYRKEINDIKLKRNLVDKVTLTEEQEKKVDELWIKNYGKKISKDWHKLYTSYMGIFNEKYFPEIFFTTNLLEKMNPHNRRKCLGDKVLNSYVFENIKQDEVRTIKNIICNCSGIFYSNDEVLSYEESIKKLKNIGEVIIKPSVDSNSGKNVNLLNIKGDIDIISEKNIKEILNKYNKNYIVQERIIQHKCFADLNPSSVNTARLNTYIFNGKVYIAPGLIRIGRGKSVIDNTHAGGLMIGIDNKTSTLRKFAFTEKGEKFDKHPDTGVKFEGYKINKFNDMLNFVKTYHYRVPHMKIISWDLTLDENENIVFIEANINCPSIWAAQYLNGEAFFGENTENMIQMLK